MKSTDCNCLHEPFIRRFATSVQLRINAVHLRTKLTFLYFLVVNNYMSFIEIKSLNKNLLYLA